MGNKNSNKQNIKLIDNKNELHSLLTRNYISDISILYNYEKKYEGISDKNIKNNEISDNFIFIICGLIDGFIEIYNTEFKLSLNFKAHRDMISKIIQLKKSGNILTSSYDNSLKIFKLSRNCTEENLIYTFYLNPAFNRIQDIIQISNDDILLISVLNHIIYFPLNQNKLSENKINLSDYLYSKYEHEKKFLNNLLEINKKLFLALDDTENRLLFFKLIPSENNIENITLLKNILVFSEQKNDKNIYSKICIENLFPKYNFILVSANKYINIIDIKYLEIVSIHEMDMEALYFFYNSKIDRIIIFGGDNIFKYKIDEERFNFSFLRENKQTVEINYNLGLETIRKSIYNPLNYNIVYFFYKKFLMKIELNFT